MPVIFTNSLVIKSLIPEGSFGYLGINPFIKDIDLTLARMIVIGSEGSEGKYAGQLSEAVSG
ncbi:hypothetical protein [Membranihabitans maritimus]|uniref:hypothetical protein n=1 Tax=Membranihabitans maritimus TaxID=2904244 RepID=UPI001F26188D|nr:hypothetical protein [Membranihabitans maritimus]